MRYTILCCTLQTNDSQKRFKLVADAMLKLADSENRFNISNHLSLLSQTSRDLAISARSVFFAGKDTLETSETTFTKLRSTIDGVQNGTSRLVEVIKSRAILVDSHQSRIWRWTTELDKAKAQVSEVSRVKEEMLADSTPSSSETSNIDMSGDIERTWLDLIFPASFR
jgi:hypothetical protein